MIFFVVVLMLLHHQNAAFGFSPTATDHFEAACHPRDSCFPSRNEDEDHLWGNYTCECGRHCLRYGTCCSDSPHAGTTLHVEYRGEKCERLSPYFPQYFVLVSRCSDRWRYEYRVRDMCERPIGGAGDPLATIPVTNAQMGVTYKNYFCAMCNFDSRDVRMWDVVLVHEARETDDEESDDFWNVTKDNLLENLSYEIERQSWGVYTDTHSFLEVKLLFKLPPGMQKFVKKCYPHIVSDCDASHEFDNGIRYRCLSYYSPVLLRAEGKQASKKYRNVHCAICNSVPDVEDIVCEEDVQRRKKPSFSFAHLLDINGDFAGKTDRCGVNRMWDPFSKKCRSLACTLPGYVIRNGKCVKN